MYNFFSITYLEKGKETIKGILEQKINNFADFLKLLCSSENYVRRFFDCGIIFNGVIYLKISASKYSGDKSHGEREMYIR